MTHEEYKARLIEWSLICGNRDTAESVARYATLIEGTKEEYEANKRERERAK